MLPLYGSVESSWVDAYSKFVFPWLVCEHNGAKPVCCLCHRSDGTILLHFHQLLPKLLPVLERDSACWLYHWLGILFEFYAVLTRELAKTLENIVVLCCYCG